MRRKEKSCTIWAVAWRMEEVWDIAWKNRERVREEKRMI